jgi:hypothetical protein
MNDTDPEIEQLVRQRLMERSGAERVVMGSRMFDVAKAMILASFPPDLTPLEVKERLCERLYGDDIDMEAFRAHLRSLPQNES